MMKNRRLGAACAVCGTWWNALVACAFVALAGAASADTEESLGVEWTFTDIGASAFVNCQSLTEVSIPDTVTSIGDNAFSNCILLEKVTIAAKLTIDAGYGMATCKKPSLAWSVSVK